MTNGKKSLKGLRLNQKKAATVIKLAQRWARVTANNEKQLNLNGKKNKYNLEIVIFLKIYIYIYIIS